MDLQYRKILLDDRQLGPYPLEKLPRANEPTVKFFGQPENRREDDNPFARGKRGEFGEEIRERAQHFTIREPLGASLAGMANYLADRKLPCVAAEQAPIPANPRVRARHLKRLLYFLGADMVSICKVPDYARYVMADGSLGGAGLDYAVVFLKVKNTATVEASRGYEWIDDPASFQAYVDLALKADVTVNYIRRLGFGADVSCIRRYKTLMTPLLIASGLAEGSRLGIGINPFVGANFKAAAVLTDMELETDKPIDFGLQDYCAHCDICARVCRSGAVSNRKKEVYNNYETWKTQETRCYLANQRNPVGQQCQRCAKLCPWNRPDSRPEDFRSWNGDLSVLFDAVNRTRAAREAADFIEPQERGDKWWFPLVTADGRDGPLTEGQELTYSE